MGIEEGVEGKRGGTYYGKNEDRRDKRSGESKRLRNEWGKNPSSIANVIAGEQNTMLLH